MGCLKLSYYEDFYLSQERPLRKNEGQEKTCVSLLYFGARYYNSDLSIWLSVDPMSDKYPSTSAYMYVRGNPILLIDPNGMWDMPSGGDPDLRRKAKMKKGRDAQKQKAYINSTPQGQKSNIIKMQGSLVDESETALADNVNNVNNVNDSYIDHDTYINKLITAENEGEIKPYEPKANERLQENKVAYWALGGVFAEGIVDDAVVYASCLAGNASKARHLNGAGTISDENVIAGVNTLSLFLPGASSAKAMKYSTKVVNAGQFNKLSKIAYAEGNSLKVYANTAGGMHIRSYNSLAKDATSIDYTRRIFGWGLGATGTLKNEIENK